MIKSKITSFVKTARYILLILAIFSILPIKGLHAETEVTQMKEIDAQEFVSTIKKKSRSGRVLLFTGHKAENPKVGKILLIKDRSTEIAAVRVLKSYHDNRFAAKNVLPFQTLEIGKEYRVLKKVGEKYINLIREREKRMDDPDRLKSDDELSKEVSPEDSELDRGIPEKSKTTPSPETTPSESDRLDGPMNSEPKHLEQKQNGLQPLFDGKGNELGGEENDPEADDEYDTDPFSNTFLPIEPHAHAVSFEYGSLMNYDVTNTAAYYNALGFRYSYILSRYWFLDKKNLQDFLAFEAGMYFYTIAAYRTPEDTVSVLPIHLTLRYNVLIGEYFSPYLYGGFMKNNVTAVSSPSVGAANLTRTVPAFGIGAMFKLGPGWSVRASLGTEGLGAGIMLRFQ